MEVNRFGAFLIHLGISLLIFAVLAGVIRFVWYPDFLFAADGGWQGIRIVAAVDLVLGPLLTLIVFDRRKPELRRDLTLIGAFQLSCLIAGTYVVYDQRPLALVYVDGRFYSMSTDSYLRSARPLPDFERFDGPHPKRLIVKLPEDLDAQAEIRRSALRTQTPLRLLSDLYVQYDYSKLEADVEAYTPEELRKHDQESQQLPAWLAVHGGSQEDYAFFPFATRYRYVFFGNTSRHGDDRGPAEYPCTGTASPSSRHTFFRLRRGCGSIALTPREKADMRTRLDDPGVATCQRETRHPHGRSRYLAFNKSGNC